MKIHKVLVGILAVSLMSSLLVGCKGEESKPAEVVPILYIAEDRVEASVATNSASNLAVFVAQCVIDDDFEAFKTVVNITEDSVLSIDSIWNDFKATVGEVDRSANVYDIESDEGKLIVTTGVVEEEYYQKDSEGNPTDYKMGDVIKDEKTITFNYEQVGDKYYYSVSDLIDTEPVRIKIPEGARLKIDGVEISESLRDKDGYFVIQGFKKANVLKAVVDTEIEKNLEFDLALVTSDMTDAQGNPIYKPIKERVFDLKCYTSLETRKAAENLAKDGLQAVITSIENNESIYKASCLKYFASSANLDDIALRWSLGDTLIHNTRNYNFSDVKLVSVEQYTDADLLSNRVTENVVEENNKGKLVLKVKTSFSRVETDNGVVRENTRTLASATISFVIVDFAIEDGEYKIVDISQNFFEGLVKRT